MSENNVLSNIDYSFTNRSNYEVALEETKDIIDVPYFPAQNLVDVSGDLNIFKSSTDLNYFIPHYNVNTNVKSIYGILNRTDARMLFVKYDEYNRDVIYKFNCVNYPQGRDAYGLTYDTFNKVWIFGGESNGRCNNDLWEYNFLTTTWTLINKTELEESSNQMPSKRKSCSILHHNNKLYFFGGNTDTLFGDYENNVTYIPLNDLWEYNIDTNTWINYDKNRILPRRLGHIIYVDDTYIKVLITGGLNEIGESEPTKIWTINKSTDAVTSINCTVPFNIVNTNLCIFTNNNFNILTGTNLYRYNSQLSSFVLIKTGISAIHSDDYYWKCLNENRYRGNMSAMGSFNTLIPSLYSNIDELVKKCDITLPPYGLDLNKVNLDNKGIFWYGGLISTSTFTERTYILSSTTNNTTIYDHPSEERPPERTNCSLTYDKYRNRVWLFGGFDGSKFYNDLWYYNLDTNKWIRVHEQLENQDEEIPTYPAPRYKSGICVCADNYLYVIAGYSDVKSFNDFWKFYIPTETWEREVPIDSIPWGSSYYIFEWGDRLWLSNGELSCIYRYFYEDKQFIKQGLLYGYVSDIYKTKASTMSYLSLPTKYSKVGNNIFVFNNEIGSIKIDLVTKEVFDYKKEFSFNHDTYWIDEYKSFDDTNLNYYFINISSLIPLTKNQLPHSLYSMGNFSQQGFFSSTTPQDIYSDYTYVDKSGIFQIQPEYEYLDKAELFLNGDISFVGKQSEYDENFTDLSNNDTIFDLTLSSLSSPATLPIRYWFLYNKQSNVNDKLKGLLSSFKDNDTSRIYCLYNNGNMVRFNTRDWTFFTYFTNIWNGAAIGYNKTTNIITAFGGLYGTLDNNNFTTNTGRIPYRQQGSRWKASNISYILPDTGITASLQQISHNGLLEYDLNIINLSTNAINGYIKNNNIQVIDYNETREYLLDIVRDYLDFSGKEQHPDTVTALKQKIYIATQPILDDLSQLDVLREEGIRPLDRAFTHNIMIDDKLYIFGGCEVGYNKPCPESGIESYPFATMSIGTSLKASDAVKNTYDKSSYFYDTTNKTWTQISSLPSRRYMGSTIASTDNRYIYLVGGSTIDLCQTPSKSILIYDTLTDTYEELKGIPENYDGRLMPILKWIDDDRLLIMYGYKVLLQKDTCDIDDGQRWTYTTYPLQNAWVYDKRHNIFYKSWEDISGTIGIVVKDNFTGNSEEESRKMMVLNPYPRIKDVTSSTDFVETAIYINEVNLLNGETTTIKCIPDSEIYKDYAPFNMSSTDLKNSQSQISSNASSDIDESMLRTLYLKTVLNKSNFRFRYAWTENMAVDGVQHKHMFVIGERLLSNTETGIEFLKLMTMGYKETHLRFWYVDLEVPEELRYMRQIKYEYPSPPIAPIMLAYDGIRYIYFIWNKYTMYRLDFKGVLSDPNASWWYKLPPLMNGDWLAEDEISVNSDGNSSWNAFFLPPRYLCMVSRTGKIARMDTETFAWFIDKRIKPLSPIPSSVGGTSNNIVEYCATNYDDNEIYKLYLGGIAGKYLNLHYRQWDNFFFDLRAVDKVVQYMKDIVEENLYPVVIKRKKLYLQNHLGHMFYSWVRIDGNFDGEYGLEDFYDAQKIRIYTDYEGVEQISNFNVSVFTLKKGWTTIPSQEYFSVVEHLDYGWDGEYTRRYIRDYLERGVLKREYTKLPNIYVDIPISTYTNSEPISKVRVQFSTENKDLNYIVRINKVDVIDSTNEVSIYDNIGGIGNQLEVIMLEPIAVDENYTITFTVAVKNKESFPLNDCYVYMVNNKWVQFSTDLINVPFTLATEKTPFKFATTIEPGATEFFYIRGINIDNKPHIGDIVIKGFYPYTK